MSWACMLVLTSMRAEPETCVQAPRLTLADTHSLLHQMLQAGALSSKPGIQMHACRQQRGVGCR